MTVLLILRALAYLWIAVEFTLLSHVYYLAYREDAKRSKIILTLQQFFMSVAILFFFLTLIPVILIVSPEKYIGLRDIAVLFCIPVGVTAHRFRTQSLRKETMKLPGKKVKEQVPYATKN